MWCLKQNWKLASLLCKISSNLNSSVYYLLLLVLIVLIWWSYLMHACSIVSNYTLQLHGLQPPRLLCPWKFPGKNTGTACHFLLQQILPTQGQNQRLLHWQADSLPQHHLGSTIKSQPPSYCTLLFKNYMCAQRGHLSQNRGFAGLW